MTSVSSATPIGTATQFMGRRRLQQKCYGTRQGDLPDPGFPFNVLQVEHSGDFPVHGHEYCELVIVLEGQAVHLTPHETHPVSAGDVFVIHAGQRHGFRAAQNLRLCNIQFDPDHFLPVNSDLGCMMGYNALFELEPRLQQADRFRSRFRLDAAAQGPVDDLIEKIHAEFHSTADGRRPMIRGAFLQLVSLLSRLYTQKRHDSPAPLVRMANVAAFVRQNYAQPLPISRLARLAHLSPSQFQRAFRKAYGTSAARFVTQVRLEAACRLLKNPAPDIATVARACGFSSPALFATRFGRMTGLTPSAYRRNMLEMPAAPATDPSRRAG